MGFKFRKLRLTAVSHRAERRTKTRPQLRLAMKTRSGISNLK